MTVRVLTGINTTGTLHLGNYCGAIRPCIRASKREDVESFFFMADLHALIKCQDPSRIELSRMQIAAAWLAAGLDPEKVTFYRQSDIIEIPLLNWMFNCVCPKGLMNRAHAYKAMLEANAAQSEDPDNGVSMGLFCYPILMAADILMFNANLVPVGRDQTQHLEMARDIATRFNNLYGVQKDFFVMPYEQIDDDVEILPGLDGRKMSKSYGNSIMLGATAEETAKLIKKSPTDSERRITFAPVARPQVSALLTTAGLVTGRDPKDIAEEIGDSGAGALKAYVIESVNEFLAPHRERRAELAKDMDSIRDILHDGNKRANAIAEETLDQVREAMGMKY